MAYTVMAYIVMAYIVVAYIVVACIVMACTVMAYVGGLQRDLLGLPARLLPWWPHEGDARDCGQGDRAEGPAAGRLCRWLAMGLRADAADLGRAPFVFF